MARAVQFRPGLRTAKSFWLRRTSAMHRDLRKREREAAAKGQTIAVYRWTLDQFREWLRAQATDQPECTYWRCSYCHSLIQIGGVEVDHKVPIAQGGLTEAANFAVSCSPCNRRKGDMHAADFEALCGALSGMLPYSRASVWRRLTAQKQHWRSSKRPRSGLVAATRGQ